MLLSNAILRLGLSARAYHRVLKVARTCADLSGEPEIRTIDVAEAVKTANARSTYQLSAAYLLSATYLLSEII